MRVVKPSRFTHLSCAFLTLAFLCLAGPAQGQQEWKGSVGAQSEDLGTQALAFLPNEIWIHAGDSITWTWQSNEIHTVTFLAVGQPYPSFQGPGAGCPGFASSPAVFDGSSCLSTPPEVKGQKFTVTFSKAGSYKFECLVHNTMTGTVHVLDLSKSLPHSQSFYDKEAAAQRKALLSDTDGMIGMNMGGDGDSDGDDGMSVQVISHEKHVTAGVGEITSTPGGIQTRSVERFLGGTLTIHAGDTVEWSNHDPEEPHTITFGFGNADPADEFDPTPNVTIDADGALHAIITSPADKVSSGFIEQALADEPGIPANPIVNAQNPGTNNSNVALNNPTRFRATFTQPGTYGYKCVLHDNLGMVGKVIVLP